MWFLGYIQKKLPNAYKIIIFSLILTAIINAQQFGYEQVAISATIAIVTTLILDTIATYIKTKSRDLRSRSPEVSKTSRKVILSETALISALIITNIFKPGEFLFIAITAALAMILKHVIRYKNAPIFNPATLGLFIIFRFVSDPVASELWWGNYNTLAVVALGLIVSWRIKKLAISFSYLIVHTLISYFRFGNAAFAFFPFFSAFFMLTEPKTSPSQMKKQIIFGTFAAIVIHIFVLLNLPSAYLLGILTANAAKLALDRIS